jgi:hypothetical protein
MRLAVVASGLPLVRSNGFKSSSRGGTCRGTSRWRQGMLQAIPAAADAMRLEVRRVYTVVRLAVVVSACGKHGAGLAADLQ